MIKKHLVVYIIYIILIKNTSQGCCCCGVGFNNIDNVNSKITRVTKTTTTNNLKKGKIPQIKLTISKDRIVLGGKNCSVVKDNIPIHTNKEYVCIYYEIDKNLFDNIENIKDISGSNEIKLSKEIPYLLVGIADTKGKYYVIYCEYANSKGFRGFFDKGIECLDENYNYVRSVSIIKAVKIISNGKITRCCNMFAYCEKLEDIDLSNFDTKNVTDMYGMFHLCKSLKSIDLIKFDTSNVTSMENMFW